MITLCTVSPPDVHYDIYLESMLDSVFRHFKHVSKIHIARPVAPVDIEYPVEDKEVLHEFKNGIEILKFQFKVRSKEYGHSLGLHACIDRATTDYIMMSDPDLFYMSAVDEFYLNAMHKFNLNYVGCSHHSATANAYLYFPYLMSTLVKKADLPDSNWMKGHLKYRDGIIFMEWLHEDDKHDHADGKYLIPGPIPELCKKLPNIKPNSLFDTSNNFCLYAMEKNWRWLSFQTVDCHYYNTKFYRTSSNFKLKERFPKQDLLWHAVRSGHKIMQEKYKEFLESKECSQ
jgi:hypothetical protein